MWLRLQSSECGQVCEEVAKATEYFPPQLAAGKGRGTDDVTARRAGLQLDGSWASRRCESLPYGRQLTRHYQFNEVDVTWSSRHNYFNDMACRRPLYSLDVSGVFTVHDEPSPVLDDTFHIDFNVSNRNFVLVSSLRSITKCVSYKQTFLGTSLNFFPQTALFTFLFLQCSAC